MFMIYLFNLCEEPVILKLLLLFEYLVKIICILLPLLVFFNFIRICIKHVIDGEPIFKSFNIMSKSLFAALFVFFIPSLCSYFFNLVNGEINMESEFSRCFVNVNIEYIKELEKRKLEESKEDINDMSEVDRDDPVFTWPENNSNNNNSDSISDQSSNSPSSSDSSLIKASKNIIIGDSRTVGMCATISGNWTNCQYSNDGAFTVGDDIYIAQGSMGYSWFNSTAVNAVNSIINANPDTTYNIYSLMGVNFLLSDIDKYIPKYIELAKNSWSKHNLILVSVNPVDETKEAQNGYSTRQSNIIIFNNKLKNGTSGVSNIKYCDTFNKVLNNLQTTDGLHYTSSTYNIIYSLMKSCVN